jgi:CubicO group peptidase (beta-lactamase class C family)
MSEGSLPMDRRALLTGSVAVGASALTSGLAPGRASASTGLTALHEAMAARIARGELVGIVYLVAHGGAVHVDTIGRKSLDSDEPIRRGTPFRIASTTKPIIGAATMMLVEDGKLALDEPVDRLLPELANRRVLTRLDGPLDQTVPATRPITVEDLLTFRMGYGLILDPFEPDDYPIIAAAKNLRLTMAEPYPPSPHEPDEWIRRFGTLPLMAQPGERWQYNAGSLVLSVLIARASGKSLPDFLRERVFRPLGMRRTGFSVSARDAARLPDLYQSNPETGQLELSSWFPPHELTQPPAFPSGASGLMSTIDDYLAFSQLLRNRGVHHGKRLLSAESVRLLTTNHLTPQQTAGGGFVLNGRGWGYCMAVSVTPDEVSQPGRYGWEGGFGTVWFTDPNRDLTAIALTQSLDFLFNGGAAEFQRLAARV